MLQLNFIDFIIILLTLVAIVTLVIWGQRGHSSQVDHLNMGRKMTLPFFVMTLVATWYGGIFGVAQIAFESGIYNFITQGIFWYLSYIIFAIWVLPKIFNQEDMTLASLVGSKIGNKSRLLATVLNLISLVPIVYILSLGSFIHLLTNIDLFYSTILGVSFVVLYSMIGGFRSVVFSDALQFVLMFSCVIIVFIYSFSSHGITALSALPSHYFNPTGQYSWDQTFSWGLLALATLVDPNFYHRCLAVKKMSIAKNGIYISIIFWIIFDLSLTVGAMYAKAIMPKASSLYAYFYYALELLPHGLKGLFVAGIFATILSTLDSFLFLSSTTFCYDILQTKSKTMYRIVLVTISVISICLSAMFDGQIKDVWMFLGSLSTGALLVPLLFHFKYKLTDNEFVLSGITTSCVVIFGHLFSIKWLISYDDIYIGIITSITTLLVLKLYAAYRAHSL